MGNLGSSLYQKVKHVYSENIAGREEKKVELVSVVEVVQNVLNGYNLLNHFICKSSFMILIARENFGCGAYCLLIKVLIDKW